MDKEMTFLLHILVRSVGRRLNNAPKETRLHLAVFLFKSTQNRPTHTYTRFAFIDDIVNIYFEK